jgi:hypothetical protein
MGEEPDFEEFDAVEPLFPQVWDCLDSFNKRRVQAVLIDDPDSLFASYQAIRDNL